MADNKELTQEQQDLLNQLQSAAPKSADSTDAYIGDIAVKNAKTLNKEYLNKDADLGGIQQYINRPVAIENAQSIDEINAVITEEQNSALAWADKDEIFLPVYGMSDELKNSLLQSKSSATQYALGVTTAEIDVLGHEQCHALHAMQNSGSNDTPYMAAEHSQITEQIANFNQYMTYAHLYKNAKAAGAETYTFSNGAEIKVDDLLKTMPGLEQEVTKNGFDEKDPACRQRIAKIASDYWNNERYDSFYAKQAREAAEKSTDYALMGAIINAREWEERKKAMVTHLKTGDGAPYDAPECLKYFVPPEGRTQQLIEGIPSPSNETLLKIDAYMNARGIKTDDEKEVFLLKELTAIAERRDTADKDLKQFLLSVSSPDKQEILYADGISVKYNDNGSASVAKDNISFSADITKTTLHKDISNQTGKYPPDAPTEELANNRTLADKQMSNACAVRDFEQKRAAQKTTEANKTESRLNQTSLALSLQQKSR